MGSVRDACKSLESIVFILFFALITAAYIVLHLFTGLSLPNFSTFHYLKLTGFTATALYIAEAGFSYTRNI